MRTSVDYALLATLVSVFILHAIPFLAVPSWAPYIAYISAKDPDTFQLLTTSILAGFAAAGGKLVVFGLSRTMGRLIRRRLVLRVSRIEYLDLLVFIAAVLPIPDDAIYVPLGVAGYRARRFAAIVVVGKIGAALGVSTLVRAVDVALSRLVGDANSTILITALSIAMTYIFLKLLVRGDSSDPDSRGGEGGGPGSYPIS